MRPGAALDAAAARARRRSDAGATWQVDFAAFTLVEQGAGAPARRPRRSHAHLRTRGADAERGPLSRAARRLRRSAHRGHALHADPRSVHAPLPEHALGQRRHRHRRRSSRMVLLYVVGGIGVGLFFMLRQRWVLWRPAACGALVVGLLQALAALNEWPLLWMTLRHGRAARDVPRAADRDRRRDVRRASPSSSRLSFMAAETLTRRAFGHHPQFWRVWYDGAGQLDGVLGRTTAAATCSCRSSSPTTCCSTCSRRARSAGGRRRKRCCTRTCSRRYVPWLSAIANSLQAGFWEECLFRAVPIAGAALIGDRFGQRRLFIVVGVRRPGGDFRRRARAVSRRSPRTRVRSS